MSTQTLWQTKPPTMEVRVNGQLGVGVAAKDIILAIIAKWGIGLGTGHIIEFTGEAIRSLSMEERMTICNMSVEAGAKAGLISPDEKTVEFLRGRRHAPKEQFDQAAEYWLSLASDADCTYDVVREIHADEIEPIVTWGTNPAMGIGVSKTVPTKADYNNESDRAALDKALAYMDLQEGQKITDIEIQHVFIGSCTNSRINDLRTAASIVKGQKIAPGVKGIVVPGSWSTKKQAEEEGLHEIFLAAGFEWRESGCSACLGMNEDVIPYGERCASTSNRNFEGRQGAGARTHLVSPAMAAAAAIYGRFVDVREIAKQPV